MTVNKSSHILQTKSHI